MCNRRLPHNRKTTIWAYFGTKYLVLAEVFVYAWTWRWQLVFTTPVTAAATTIVFEKVNLRHLSIARY